MATGRYPYFSQAGWLPFLVVGGLGVLFAQFMHWSWAVPFWLVCLGIVFLYRDPQREIPSSPLAVVSPADGVLDSVDEAQDPYLNRAAIMMVIEMGHLDVFSTRSPVEGKVLEPLHTDGGGEGRPHGVWLKTDEDDDIVVAMHRGPLNNNPRCYVRIGERVGQGQRCGHIYLGGRVEIYLPANSRVEVSPGSHLQAGSDVIATLVHKS